jgi:hypothetical protein
MGSDEGYKSITKCNQEKIKEIKLNTFENKLNGRYKLVTHGTFSLLKVPLNAEIIFEVTLLKMK